MSGIRRSLLAAGLLGVLLCAGCGRDRASGPLKHEAYVWQRRWTASVQERVLEKSAAFSGITALAAEIEFAPEKTRVVRPDIDLARLRAARCPVSLALRIGPHRGVLSVGDDPTFAVVEATAREVVASARAAGLELAELHVDFDCPERSLPGFALWLRELRRIAAPARLTITALPSWLGASGIEEVLAATDGYVVQVHSIAPPGSAEGPLTLCDPAAARRAVEQAGRLGVAFRVALPTYGYAVAFDAQGRILRMLAEGSAANFPRNATVREVEADPAEMAALVQGWTRDRPAQMRGVIWYRLPMPGDSRNWPWETLSAILDGRTPRASLRVESRQPRPGLAEIFVMNDGETAEPLARALAVRLPTAVLASDGLQGYRAEQTAAATVVLRPPLSGMPSRISPGEERMTGWITYAPDAPAEVSVSFADE